MPDGCSIRVYVRCRPTAIEAREESFERPVASSPVTVLAVRERRWSLRWACRLDDANHLAVREARRLGREAGVPVRVVDLGRGNPFVRALRRAWVGPRSLPVVVLRGACVWHDEGPRRVRDPRSSFKGDGRSSA